MQVTIPSWTKPALLAGLFVLIGLYALEMLHYRRWEPSVEHVAVVPLSKAVTTCPARAGHPLERWCNLPGYGPTLFHCTLERCTYQDPSAKELPLEQATEEDRWNRIFFEGPEL